MDTRAWVLQVQNRPKHGNYCVDNQENKIKQIWNRFGLIRLHKLTRAKLEHTPHMDKIKKQTDTEIAVQTAVCPVSDANRIHS